MTFDSFFCYGSHQSPLTTPPEKVGPQTASSVGFVRGDHLDVENHIGANLIMMMMVMVMMMVTAMMDLV